MKKILCLALILFAVLCLGACSDTKPNNEKLNIVAVSFPEYDFARAVAGDKAEITMLIPPAGEAHGYEPTVSDIKAVSNCDLFVYTGGESDSWAESILKSAGNKNVTTLALINCVSELHSETDTHSHDKYKTDEHVWTSPENAIEIVNHIKNALCEIAPENEVTFEQNSKSYCQKLAELDDKFEIIAENSNGKPLVFGDRFPLTYFAEEYDLEYLAAFSGCSEDTEASASTIANLIDYVKENDIPIVFVNELSNTAIAEQIAKETGAEVKTFYSCHKVSKDDFESGKTYVDIMSRNTQNLENALN